MAGQNNIQTDVEKLVSLVDQYGKITFKVAAKKLALPADTIEQWAQILETEGVIELQFGLGSPTIIRKELTEKQAKERISKFKDEKDLFNKRLESAESYFDELDKKINIVVDIMKNVEDTVGKKLIEVDADIEDLRLAEEKKEYLDRLILRSKESSHLKLKEVESHIKALKLNYEKEYAAARKELISDQDSFAKNQKFLEKVKEQELLLQEKMSDVKALSQSIQEEVDNRSKQLEVTEKSMHEIQKKHELLQKELESEHLSLKELIQQNEVQEKEVQRLQKIIFDRMNHDEADLEKKEYEIKEFPKRFSEFVSHKKEIHDIINVIGHEEIELRTEIDELRRQAKIIDISVGTAGYDKELVKLKDRMSSLTSKRSFFKEKIEQLTHILDWSTHRAVKEEKI